MADVVDGGICCSQFLVNSKGDNDVSTCKRCRNYENLLKEALDELNSIQMINRLLQKELLAYMAPKSTWGINPNSTENNENNGACSKWTLVTTKNHTVNPKKHDKSDTMTAGHFIKTTNHYIPLTTVPISDGCAIPVVVSGAVSAKGSVKATNRSISHKPMDLEKLTIRRTVRKFM